MKKLIIIFYRLYHVSSRMKEQLLEASEMQEIILDNQKHSLQMQNKLLDHGKELGIVLKSSSESVNNLVKDFKWVFNIFFNI